MKEYVFKKQYLIVSIILPTILLLGVFFWGVYNWNKDPANTLAPLAVILVPVLLFAQFFSLNQPTKITDDGEYITFRAFLKEHAYKWDSLTTLKVKRFLMTDKIYVRIGSAEKPNGKYWLELGAMNNPEEIYNKLVSFELLLHPEEARKYVVAHTRRGKR